MPRLFPPFDPDERPRLRQRPLPQIPVRRLIPNVVTLLALCAGLTAIRMVIEGRFELAIYAILFAAALDGIDGRVARLLRTTSRFGAELDSLTDFVNFGVAPAILLHVWALDDLGSFGWVAALIFAICCALRLARFNTALDNPDKPAWQNAYFVGVPAPAGAVIALLPLYVEFLGVPYGPWTAPLVVAYTILVGMLMISRLPTWSGKLVGRKIPRDRVPPLFVALVVIVALLVSFPFYVLAAGTLAYLATLPLARRAFIEHKERAAAEADPIPANVEPLRLEPPPDNDGGPSRQGRIRKGAP